jgi:hypothetical protein
VASGWGGSGQHVRHPVKEVVDGGGGDTVHDGAIQRRPQSAGGRYVPGVEAEPAPAREPALEAEMAVEPGIELRAPRPLPFQAHGHAVGERLHAAERHLHPAGEPAADLVERELAGDAPSVPLETGEPPFRAGPEHLHRLVVGCRDVSRQVQLEALSHAPQRTPQPLRRPPAG